LQPVAVGAGEDEESGLGRTASRVVCNDDAIVTEVD
jgi:hypothetical protein